MGMLKDLTGLKFGMLFVKGRAESVKGKTMWLVRCDCGKEKSIRSESIITGSAKSCGCATSRFRKTKLGKQFSLVNQRFGRLWVIWRVGSRVYGFGSPNALWECKCDCGNIVKVTGRNLRSGKTKSCGCLHREFLADCALGHSSLAASVGVQ